MPVPSSKAEKGRRRKLKPLAVYLGADLQGELRAWALREGMADSAAARVLLEAGLAAVRLPDDAERNQVDQLRALLQQTETLLEIIGPPIVGLPSLVVYWAAHSGSLGVEEDELLAEFWRESTSLWDAEMNALDEDDAESHARGV